MGRRSKRADRCPRCRMHVGLCICDAMDPIATRTRLALIIHRREVWKSTNTGRIGLLALSNAQVFVRGDADAPADLAPLGDPSRRLLLLFPREDAVVLTPELVAADPRPVTLAVPDGSWTQARRCARREAVLAGAPAVLPPDVGPTRYRLRHEHVEGGLGTGEAIARAFAVLEGAEVGEAIQRLFDLQVARTLATRGVAHLDDGAGVTGD